MVTLLLERAHGRVPELATRLALGASRARVARQLVVESMPLAGLGGLVGFCLAWLSVGRFMPMALTAMPQLQAGLLDREVLVFAAAVSVAVGLVCGIVPAWHATAINDDGVPEAGPGRYRGGSVSPGRCSPSCR